MRIGGRISKPPRPGRMAARKAVAKSQGKKGPQSTLNMGGAIKRAIKAEGKAWKTAFKGKKKGGGVQKAMSDYTQRMSRIGRKVQRGKAAAAQPKQAPAAAKQNKAQPGFTKTTVKDIKVY